MKTYERLLLLEVFTFKLTLPWLKVLLLNDQRSRLLPTSMESHLLKFYFDGVCKLEISSCPNHWLNLVLKPMLSFLTLNWMPMIWKYSIRLMKVWRWASLDLLELLHLDLDDLRIAEVLLEESCKCPARRALKNEVPSDKPEGPRYGLYTMIKE